MTVNHEYYMRLAIEQALLAYQAGEIPVGAVIVDTDGNVIGRGFNRTILDNDPSAHAEIVALRDAGERVKNYRLINLDMYVTLEPCTMCSGALIHSRLNNLYFGAYDLKTGACGSRFNILGSSEYNHIVNVTGGILKEECQNIISDFFKARRKMQKDGRDWIVESGKVRSWQKKCLNMIQIVDTGLIKIY